MKDCICEHCKKPFTFRYWHRFCSRECSVANSIRPLKERLLEKVIGDLNGVGDSCVLWLGMPDPDGYGHLWVKGKQNLAHRVSWEVAYGPIPDGLCVLHKCDTPLCVRPDHLFLGTQSANIADKVAKSRQAVGERMGLAKLTEENVREIRRLRSEFSLNSIAKKFNVSKKLILLVCQGKIWKHVT